MILKNLLALVFTALLFVNAIAADAPAGSRSFGKNITLRYHTNDGGMVHNLNIVKVHPNIWIHYFPGYKWDTSRDDNSAFMWLNHGMDVQGNKFYYSVLYPVIGMKTYVTRTEVAGAIMPLSKLDEDSKDILALQISEVERHGGSYTNYVNDLLVKRGSFGDDQSFE